MWTDFYLRAPSEADFLALLPEDGFDTSVALDVLGVLSGVAGWHVNVRVNGLLPPVFLPFEIPAPAFPKRVFA